MEEQSVANRTQAALNLYPIAGSILIGFAMVAGAIFVTSSDSMVPAKNAEGDVVAIPEVSAKRENNRIVYGDTDAPTTIVEFSDYECPFCARVHPTIKRIVDESGGEINWEYRHLPLPIHRNAHLAAMVGECVFRTLGNESFWEYSDIVLANQKGFSDEYLIGVIEGLGAEESAIEMCLANQSTQEQIASDMATAQALGGSGTPFNVIVKPDGSIKPVSGALPYESWLPLLQ